MHELKIKRSSLQMGLIFVLIINDILYIPGFDTGKLYFFIRNAGAVIGVAYVFLNYKTIIKGRIKTAAFAILFVAWGFISAKESNMITPQTAIFLINTITLTMFAIVVREKGKFDSVLYAALLFFGAVCLVNDVDMFAKHYRSAQDYLIGNKFDVVYFHLILLSLLLCIPKIKKLKSVGLWYVLAALVILICFYVNCMSSFIGVAIFMFLLSYKKLNRFSGWKSYLLILFFVFAFNIIYGYISSTSFVQSVLLMLKRDVSLTGRMAIYEIAIPLIANSPIWGYGYGTTIVYDLFGFANLQNGIFDLMLNYGIPGMTLFLLMIGNAIVTDSVWVENKSLFCLIITFLILGAIEITYGKILIVVVVILLCYKENL